MRIWWISRANKPNIASMSEFFLSITTGIILIAHFRYLSPLIASENYLNLQNSMVFLVTASLLKGLLLLACHRFYGDKAKKEEEKARRISYGGLIYTALIKTALYLSIVLLLSGGQGLDVSIASISALSFSCWLFLCGSDNKMAKSILKGRNFSSNPLKTVLLYLLALTAIFLQPSQYQFSFPLHFQIFIIFITAFLIFSYFYLHRLVSTLSTREKSAKVLCQESLYEVLSLLLIWLYYIFVGQQGLNFMEQLDYLLDKWQGLIVISVLCTAYELSLWQHIRKVALNQLAVTLSTGFLWFNIYLMAHNGINTRLYLSVLVMIAVLLTNIGFFSQENWKMLSKLLTAKKMVKRRQHLEQEQTRRDQQ